MWSITFIIFLFLFVLVLFMPCYLNSYLHRLSFFPSPFFFPEMLSYPAFGQALTVYRFSIQPLSPPFPRSIALYLAIHRPFIRFSAFAPWSLLFRFFSKTKTPLTPLLHLVFSIVLHDYTIVLVCYILLPLCVFKYASCMY